MTWAVLKTESSGADVPLLVYSATFTPSSYSLLVSDLSHIWHDERDKTAILEASQDQNTIIDPCEDSSQLKILLKQVEGALQHERGTKCYLESAANDKLILRTSSQIPGLAQVLEWSFDLVLQPQGQIRDSLTVPLLHAVSTQQHFTDDLTKQLKAKDHVIARLLDKLDEQRVPLQDVFPQTAGRGLKHAISRATAARLVEGLGKFDDAARNNKESELQAAPIIEKLMAGGSSTENYSRTQFPLLPMTPHWYRDIPGADARKGQMSGTKIPDQITEAASEVVVEDQEDMTIDDEDEFQRQATPPSYAKHAVARPATSASARTHQEDDGGSTTDEDDLDQPAIHLTSRPSQTSQQSPSNGIKASNAPTAPDRPANDNLNGHSRRPLGALGGRRKPDSLASPLQGSVDGLKEFQETMVPSSSTNPHRDTHDRRSAASTEYTTPAPETPKKSKLGAIGGLKKAAKPGATASQALLSKVDVYDQDLSLTNERVATLDTVEDVDAGVEMAQQPPLQIVEQPQSEPTDEEKADRKREELKRQLEARAQVPSKKKKRF